MDFGSERVPGMRFSDEIERVALRREIWYLRDMSTNLPEQAPLKGRTWMKSKGRGSRSLCWSLLLIFIAAGVEPEEIEDVPWTYVPEC